MNKLIRRLVVIMGASASGLASFFLTLMWIDRATIDHNKVDFWPDRGKRPAPIYEIDFRGSSKPIAADWAVPSNATRVTKTEAGLIITSNEIPNIPIWNSRSIATVQSQSFVVRYELLSCTEGYFTIGVIDLVAKREVGMQRLDCNQGRVIIITPSISTQISLFNGVRGQSTATLARLAVFPE